MDLKKKCLDWIDRHVPAHSRHEMRLLMERNERLALQLISAHFALEDARKEIDHLTNALYAKLPMPTWRAEGDAAYHIEFRERCFRLRWSIDPMQQNMAISDMDFVRDRYAVPYVAEAMKRHFMEEVAPQLFDRAFRHIVPALAA